MCWGGGGGERGGGGGGGAGEGESDGGVWRVTQLNAGIEKRILLIYDEEQAYYNARRSCKKAQHKSKRDTRWNVLDKNINNRNSADDAIKRRRKTFWKSLTSGKV